MIRARRVGLVQTVADLAVALGVSVKTLRNTQPYAAPGFPAPVSSPRAQKLLWGRGADSRVFRGPRGAGAAGW
jgi:hypothetical protein